MCGIVAMYSPAGGVVRGRLERAVRALHHRGPDAEGFHVDPGGRVGLGHARLGIIDLEGGQQPIANEDGSIHAVVNGELYDFERVRAELEERGHRFRTKSDSEILVHLYEEFGASAVSRLRGEFAFVLYDANNDLLLAGRDRFGIKPLHYGHLSSEDAGDAGGALALASEAKALFAAGLPARWDEESFFHSSTLGGPLDDRTFFSGVRQLPAGHLLVVTPQGERIVRYWDFDYPRVVSGSSSPATDPRDDVEALRSALEEAVRLRLRADVPVACYLSGGLDSCAVLGLASSIAADPIHAFTLAFDRPEYDEAPIAEEMAARAGARFTRIPVAEGDFARDFADACWSAERPLNNANGVAKFRLSRAVRDVGIKVVLTGEGSDEIFGGYPHYRRDLFRHVAAEEKALAALEQTNAVSRGILLPQGEGLPVVVVERALGVAPTWLEAFATSGQKVRGLLDPGFRARFGARDPLALFLGTLEVGRQIEGRHPVHQAMYMWSKSVLPNFILSVLGDRMEMAHSVEGRLPFLDHVVVELASRMPIDRLIRGTVEKFVLREAVKSAITDTVYRRQKHPFFAPPAATRPGGPLHELMQDTLRSTKQKDVRFFDPRAVVGLLDALPSMDVETQTAVDAPLMLLLSTTLMQERFAISP